MQATYSFPKVETCLLAAKYGRHPVWVFFCHYPNLSITAISITLLDTHGICNPFMTWYDTQEMQTMSFFSTNTSILSIMEQKGMFHLPHEHEETHGQ